MVVEPHTFVNTVKCMCGGGGRGRDNFIIVYQNYKHLEHLKGALGYPNPRMGNTVEVVISCPNIKI